MYNSTFCFFFLQKKNGSKSNVKWHNVLRVMWKCHEKVMKTNSPIS
jgi:hypothetical protein